LGRGGPQQGRPFYDNQNLQVVADFPERGFLPPAIGVRGGMTKRHKKNKTKKNNTKRRGKISKNKTKKHKINRNKITKKTIF
jgi:hypothetical protein